MIGLIVRRLLAAGPTLLLVALLVFSLQHLLPGDPLLVLAGEDRDPVVLEELRVKYGLDQPVWWQFLAWLGLALRGDLGTSYKTGQPVLELVLEKLPVTLELGALALLIALVIGLPLGVLAAHRRGSTLDRVLSVVSLAGLSIPNFALGVVLILVVAVHLKWLPASGYVSPFEDLRGNLRAVAMPAFVLGLNLSASLMRHTRAAMIAELSRDYVRTARAKGLREPAVVLGHALRNAMGPVVTVTALVFGELLAGAVLTEQVFSIPGFGKLVVDAVFNRDYAVVQGVVLVTGTGFVLLNLVADLAQRAINPRLRAA